MRELTVTEKVTLTGTIKKAPPPRYPPKIRPQGVCGEVSVDYKFLLGPFLRAGVGIRIEGDTAAATDIRSQIFCETISSCSEERD